MSESARWYTTARRIPTLVGRLHDGSKIPGGPYSTTQIAGGAIAGGVLYLTRGMWSGDGFIANIVIVGVVIAATVFLAGRIHLGVRNPLALAFGVLGRSATPSGGKIAGRQLEVRAPRSYRYRLTIGSE